MRSLMTIAVAAVSTALLAGPNGDRPDASHAWAVHDENRPRPPQVETCEGRAPSDATVLFDGTMESVRMNWCDKDGGETKWTVKDGIFICTPSSGGVRTREEFGDCQLHVEFQIPDPPGEGLGNSGIHLLGKYEVQILDSYHDPFQYAPPWRHADYADGSLGAIYGQEPPIVNASRAPGKWQVFDIVFHPAEWNGDALVEPARMTVFLNGLLVHDNWPLEGPTGWLKRAKHDKEKEKPVGPVSLQDHGNPVRFRNIWIRPIPSRRANTVHGGDSFNAADAAKLRSELAAKTLALARKAEKDCDRLVWLWESHEYTANADVRREIDVLTEKYAAYLATLNGEVPQAVRTELSNMWGFAQMGVRCGFLTEESQLFKALKRALDATKVKERLY